MNALRFTLVTDGPTDAVLLYPLRWLLIKNGVDRAIEPAWADLRQLPKPPTCLEDKITRALDLYPCELLFVHRDAERESREKRLSEIHQAVKRLSPSPLACKPYVCVVPVRMTEAWLLFDELAIRRAAGNPAGGIELSLPTLSVIESLPDPKQDLHNLLKSATELSPRRLKKFSAVRSCYRLAELIEDFSPLRRLSAFASLETELRDTVRKAGWTSA
ncbi:MAG: hypothetical protein WCO56_25245 [Verrucomicrobiota bacterium]